MRYDYDDGIFRSAPSTNPVVIALAGAGLYRAPQGNRAHSITCPWEAEHGPEDQSATYTEPGTNTALGAFSCVACNKQDRHIGTLLSRLDVEPSSARAKARVRLRRGEMHRIAEAAERVLLNVCDYYQAGGAIARVKSDPRSGDVTTEYVTEQALTLALSAGADWESQDKAGKSWNRVDVPTRIVQALMKKGDFQHLKHLNGLARQPYFRGDEHLLIRTSGYDEVSGMYAAFEGGNYQLPEPTEANALAALDALHALIEELHFASPSDRSAAISAMLSCAIRPSLPLCPAFSVSASRPGSGKSYLASVIAAFGGPGDPFNTSYPTSTEEASKLALSMMMTSPAVVCFDDMTSDWIAYPAINRMLTSETITDRVLGASKMATARTASFILGTGNNIRPLRDMTRRVVSIYLSPRVEDITSLRYRGNPLKTVRSNRAAYVGHSLTIVAAHLKAGSPRSDCPTIPSYDGWSHLCRDSLIGLGQPDPAASLIAQVNDDPDMQAFGELLTRWRECFGERPTMVRTVTDRAEGKPNLKAALLELPVAERGFVNPSKLGRYLARHANRIVNGHELRKSPNGERNAWTVIAVDQALRDRPPPEPEQVPEIARMWIKEMPPLPPGMSEADF
ncbi:hypothetical protein [Sphingomonas sp. G-3-2-10]|uniref:hypothetical protein n=1 Tax=Sphingomonas sp. G-3-2-10 TaxID=2728838 RepID=UPI00146CE0AE|nr:hypothetical protein [Sphingomonas sp. G-3-2-10]NML06531.1 hypothetical protein [Sphingomonas sp. G-3-2-10]